MLAAKGRSGLRWRVPRRALLVAGCGDSGFRPMYASSAIVGGTEVNQKLAELEIAPIPGRVGQRLRNELIYQSTGGGLAAQPVYRLEIIIRESLTPTLVQIDGNSSGSVYNLDTSFRLVRLADKIGGAHRREPRPRRLPALRFRVRQRAGPPGRRGSRRQDHRRRAQGAPRRLPFRRGLIASRSTLRIAPSL